MKLDDASHNQIAGGLGWDAEPPFLPLNDQRSGKNTTRPDNLSPLRFIPVSCFFHSPFLLPPRRCTTHMHAATTSS